MIKKYSRFFGFSKKQQVNSDTIYCVISMEITQIVVF